MQDLTPFFGWQKYYVASEDKLSPFYGKRYDFTQYSSAIYDHYIHPSWDYIGSETLYIKFLFVHYQKKVAIIEMFGEWNDAIHNDIMHFKRNILDFMDRKGIQKYILIGENILNFHGSDDSYYEEWFDDVEDGWIAALNFRYHVEEEWKKYRLDFYLNFGGTLHIEPWRTMNPLELYELVQSFIVRRLG